MRWLHSNDRRTTCPFPHAHHDWWLMINDSIWRRSIWSMLSAWLCVDTETLRTNSMNKFYMTFQSLRLVSGQHAYTTAAMIIKYFPKPSKHYKQQRMVCNYPEASLLLLSFVRIETGIFTHSRTLCDCRPFCWGPHPSFHPHKIAHVSRREVLRCSISPNNCLQFNWKIPMICQRLCWTH